MIETAPLQPGCPEPCPGCSHRGISSGESLARKRAFLSHALGRWESAIEDIRAVPEAGRLGYRERTCLRAEWAGDRWSFGLLARDRRAPREKARLIAIPGCPVHSERVVGVLEALARGLPSPEILP